MKSTKLYDESIYPYLGVANSGYPVVLFTERNQGMVVSISPTPNDQRYYLGQFRKDWIMGDFSRFAGRIVLEN
jgi:hypothetical protein